jgi:hypothetical protein
VSEAILRIENAQPLRFLYQDGNEFDAVYESLKSIEGFATTFIDPRDSEKIDQIRKMVSGHLSLLPSMKRPRHVAVSYMQLALATRFSSDFQEFVDRGARLTDMQSREVRDILQLVLRRTSAKRDHELSCILDQFKKSPPRTQDEDVRLRIERELSMLQGLRTYPRNTPAQCFALFAMIVCT